MWNIKERKGKKRRKKQNNRPETSLGRSSRETTLSTKTKLVNSVREKKNAVQSISLFRLCLFFSLVFLAAINAVRDLGLTSTDAQTQPNSVPYVTEFVMVLRDFLERPLSQRTP